ncbi:MAG: hypothetical protein KBA31_07430 [Alphaproteobacteria bacterium]|nr:hypothetical protein [Alphaproteobacteria bacterium]
MHLILRIALLLIALPFAQAHAQPQTVETQVQLGVREAGKTHPLALNAQNADCKEPLDFRFTSNAAWLKLPADPVVRGVAMGQSRALLATIDLTNVSPGRYQATVDVQCENCGWLLFQSCKIDRQQISFVLDVTAAPQPQPPGVPGGNAPASRAIDPSDPRLPPAIGERLKKAYDDRDAAGAQNPCEEALKKLAAEAKAAQDAADALNKQADNAAQAKKDIEERLKKAEQDDKAAGRALEEAREQEAKAAKEAEAMQVGKQFESDREKEARLKAEAKAKAAKEKADKAQDARREAQKALDDARKAAADATAAAAKGQPSQAERNAADEKARAAQAALAKQQADCDKATADAKAKAQAEVDKAEKAARDVLAALRLAAEKELNDAQQEADRCKCHLARLILTQKRAIEALVRLGAITGEQQSALKQWADKLREINELITMLPDCPYKELVQTLMSSVTFVLDMLEYAQPVFNAELIPGTRSHIFGDKTAEKTKTFLRNEGLTGEGKGGDGITADEVYQQMKNYADPDPDSMKKLIDDLDAAKSACHAADARLERAKDDAAKARK